jgi:hypothetical protein
LKGASALNLKLTTVKFVSITCEHSAEKKMLEALRKAGVRSVRASTARIEDFGGDAEVDLLGTQVKLDFLASEDVAERVISAVQGLLKQHFDLGFFMTEAQVLRPHVFYETPT